MVRKLALVGFILLLLVVALGDRSRKAPINPVSGVPAHTQDERSASGGPATVFEAPVAYRGPDPRPGSGFREATGSRRSIPRLVKIKELEPAVKKYAEQHGVDEDLVWAVMRHESGFNPQAVSPKGAMGLMQLMPGTASLMGVDDPFDAEQNIAGGIKYLDLCLSRFNHDIALALAAYNAGPQNVARYQGCPPFPETRQYVAVVLKTYAGQPRYRRLGFALAANDEVTELLNKVGLPWRVPLPQWKVVQPQCRVAPPRWKGSRTDLVSCAR